ncbi:MAG TPA: c-type cytochrome [Hanamia sp.]|nr:c-type cytochrome [Hanamia sp.]
MIKTFTFILISVTFVFLFDSINFAAAFEKKSQPNNPPSVKIISPKNNTVFSTGTPIHYSITVSDKEDGDSKYDEINPKEVLLQVKLLNDTVNMEMIKNRIENDSPGLMALRISNCFNCHSFDSKLIGPSFEEINKRYKPTAENIALLSKRIREGSSGVWGKVSMPTHPELSDSQTQNMIKWIMQNASSSNVHYYIGIEGSLTLKAQKTYLLTASYTDHGINNSGQRLKGQDVIVIFSR